MELLAGGKALSIFAVKTTLEKRFRWLRGLVAGNDDQPSLLFVGILAFASLIIIGYHFAVWDQLLYLGFVDRYFQPIIDHPGDLYVTHFLWHSYTTFWMLIYPLKELFGWEWPLFTIHILVKFFIFWGIWSLSFAFTRDRLTAWLTVLLMLMNKAIVSGDVNFYAADTITRYVVLPFLLFAVKKLWEGNYVGAALLFGCAFQIHALSAVYWLLAIAISYAFYRVFNGALPPNPQRVGRALGLFALLAGPILIWFVIAEWNTASPPPNAEFMNLIHSHHGYAFLAHYDSAAWKTLLFFALIIVVALRYFPENKVSRWYLPFTFGILTVLSLCYVAADGLFYQPILKFQLCRIVDLFGLLAVIGAAQILATHANRGGRQRWLAALIAGLFLVASVTPGRNVVYLAIATLFLLLLALEPSPGRFTVPAIVMLVVFLGTQVAYPSDFGRSSWHAPVWTLLMTTLLASATLLFMSWFATLTNRRAVVRHTCFACCLTGLILLVMFERIRITEVPTNWKKQSFTNQQIWERMVRRTEENLDWPGQGMSSNWIQFQLWVRANTPTGTMFFVPPGMNGFRVFSQRNAFFEGYDCEPAIFQTDYAAALIERMKIFEYWPATDRNLDRAEQVYYALKPARWQELALRWDVPYLITARPANLPFQKLYTRDNLTLWKIVP